MKMQLEKDTHQNEKAEMMVQTPFIKLFRSPRGYYFFDTNRDSICSVDCDTFTKLESSVKHIDSGEDSETITQLKEDGWLSSHRPVDVENDLTDQVDIRLNHYVSQLNLQVTQACNLCCIYCPFANNINSTLSRSHSNKTMTFETAKKAIDFLAAHSDGLDRVSICFYGGEPLVDFNLIKQCVDYAEYLLDGKEILYFITTNATLMTDEVIDFLVRHSFHITFSLDGPKQIHDSHRIRADGTPTYDLVMETLEKTVTSYGNKLGAHVMINMVMNPADSFDEILNWLDTPILKKIIIQTSLVEDDCLEKKFNMTSEFLRKMSYHTALSWLSRLGLVDGLKTNVITDTMVNGSIAESIKLLNGSGVLPDVISPGGPCMSGVRKLFVNADGVFFPCEKVNELSESMMIGNLNTGFDHEQVKRHINIAKLSPEACKNCWALVHCTTCQRQADGGKELSGVAKNRNCEQVRRSFLTSLKTSIMVQESKTLYRLPKGEG